MKILSQTNIQLIGTVPCAFPMPDLLRGVYGEIGPDTAVVTNLGICACLLAVTPTASPNSAQSGTVIPSTINDGVQLYGSVGAILGAVQASVWSNVDVSPGIGPYVSIPLAGGGGWWAAVCIPTLVSEAWPQVTAALNASTLTVSSATGIVIGQYVDGRGIQPGTVVMSISGTSVGISLPTTAALGSPNTDAAQFFSLVSPTPPTLVAVTLANSSL